MSGLVAHMPEPGPGVGVAWPEVPPAVLQQIVACAETLLIDSAWAFAHVQQVTRLALQLFDRTRELHSLAPEAQPLLQAAALGHDIGYPHDPDRHHKQSYRRLRKALRPLAGDDLATLVACTARYHRRALPKSKHGGFRRLGPEEQGVVERLAALLRIADGLDRAHLQRVREVRSEVRPELWRVIAIGAGPEELWGTQRKANLAQRVFGRAVEIVEG